MEKQNREQRRQAKFGSGRANAQGGWPTAEPNPVFGAGDAPEDETAGEPDHGHTKDPGPATADATEPTDPGLGDGRAPGYEGTNASERAKS